MRTKTGLYLALTGAAAVAQFFGAPAHAQQLTPGSQYLVDHSECAFFGPQREKFVADANRRNSMSAVTTEVTHRLAYAVSGGPSAFSIPSGTRTAALQQTSGAGFIDKLLFQAMKTAGVAPADKTNDYEFIRRVTLDLTGRIPLPERVVSFTSDTAPDKRAKLIDELLNSPAWVDKWTMYYGDLFKNSSFKQQVNLYNESRNSFYKWIKDSLSNNKPYNKMAQEIIGASGTNTWDPAQGALVWSVGGRVTGGPVQDTQDQITANVAETFLGLANLNCLLCHNGRGHLDQLNLWAAGTTRYQAWQVAAFLAHTPNPTNIRPDPTKQNSYYWSQVEQTAGQKGVTDYALGSTSGNRPARAVTTEQFVKPVYIFNGDAPRGGESYRQALARNVTGDFQFARASVNYMWQQFFGRGIVEPANQFDLARLDPNNPPPDPWTLQPSNPQLLTALAQSFIDSNYDIKALMRTITNSDAYQLSSRYNGTWSAANDSLFARKQVRRLWAEEMHDAIALSSHAIPTYNVYLGQDPNDIPGGTVKLNWAMQFPETVNVGPSFLDAFLRGNRDDEPRRGEGSLSQALNLMNDPFVMTRVHVAQAGANSLVATAVKGSDDQMVTLFYLNVLSRYPTDAEKQTALASLKQGDRNQKAENLLWSLYNKVDFIFNY